METDDKIIKEGNYVEKNKKGLNIILVIVITMIISVLVSVGGTIAVIKLYPEVFGTTVTNVSKLEKEVTVTDTGLGDAVEKVYDSVIVVENHKSGKLRATGTGFVYKKDGNKYYFLTNQHVVQNADEIKVVFTNGEEVTVELVGGDVYADIAVLSYETDKELEVAQVGSSVDMRVGDTVFAIGAPLDSEIYSWSVTRGVLSGKDREVKVATSSNTSDWIMQVLQTDAAINSGNSGGPLCNSNGQVIGITNMKLASTGIEGMGFAIPIEEAMLYADALIGGGDVSRPYLGIGMYDAAGYSSMFGYDENTTGVIITQVEEGKPAEKAGLRIGDIIIGVNDAKVESIADLRYQLYKYKAGDVIKIKYLRNNKEYTAEVTLIANK